MKQISAILEIYKTKCEQYFNEHGRNWRQMFKDYVNKRKAEKAQNKKNKYIPQNSSYEKFRGISV